MSQVFLMVFFSGIHDSFQNRRGCGPTNSPDGGVMQDKGIWEKSHIRYSGPAVRAAFSLVLNMGFGMGIEQLFKEKI